MCVCVPRERAQRRGRGLATTAQRDALWMVDGGDESGVVEGQALTLRRERKEWADSDRGQILAALSLVAGHCSIALLVNEVATTTGLLPFMEEGGRRQEGGGGRRNNPGMQKEQTEKA